MTMSITITNTSNWAGENVEINGRQLTPGDSVELPIRVDESIRVNPKPRAQTKPFLRHGVQVFPVAKTVWIE